MHADDAARTPAGSPTGAPAPEAPRTRPPLPVTLRELRDSDLPTLYEDHLDPESNRMAAFTPAEPADWETYRARWARLSADPAVVMRVIAGPDGEPVGQAAVFGPPEERSVTYRVRRAHWGRGVATAALRQLLDLVPERPLHARAACDNAASLRVLRRCGFVVTGTETNHAPARGAEIDEHLLLLEA
ncbi:GNAT family N-acetyltransferase [Streptomyces sp. NRRL S-87]|uniref:GNAT family N-acetyltransferase n=1 Tax=Streptomyces sp. NRRL S-87 TaxID=1463920 RepID=UPI00099BD811|nr:GNAT family N-acetyltransferase [Streptomyces sp. NRRL S-87]